MASRVEHTATQRRLQSCLLSRDGGINITGGGHVYEKSTE